MMTHQTDSPSLPPAQFDATSGTVRATIEIAVPPERVFEALTDPEELASWWGGGEGGDVSYRAHDWEIDTRPGGLWSAKTTDTQGDQGEISGEIIAIDPPRLIEYSWRASWEHHHSTIVRYELAPVLVGGASGTCITVTHTGFGVRAEAGQWHAAGCVQALANLSNYSTAMYTHWHYEPPSYASYSSVPDGRSRLLVHA